MFIFYNINLKYLTIFILLILNTSILFGEINPFRESLKNKNQRIANKIAKDYSLNYRYSNFSVIYENNIRQTNTELKKLISNNNTNLTQLTKNKMTVNQWSSIEKSNRILDKRIKSIETSRKLNEIIVKKKFSKFKKIINAPPKYNGVRINYNFINNNFKKIDRRK